MHCPGTRAFCQFCVSFSCVADHWLKLSDDVNYIRGYLFYSFPLSLALGMVILVLVANSTSIYTCNQLMHWAQGLCGFHLWKECNEKKCH